MSAGNIKHARVYRLTHNALAQEVRSSAPDEVTEEAARRAFDWTAAIAPERARELIDARRRANDAERYVRRTLWRFGISFAALFLALGAVVLLGGFGS